MNNVEKLNQDISYMQGRLCGYCIDSLNVLDGECVIHEDIILDCMYNGKITRAVLLKIWKLPNEQLMLTVLLHDPANNTRFRRDVPLIIQPISTILKVSKILVHTAHENQNVNFAMRRSSARLISNALSDYAKTLSSSDEHITELIKMFDNA